MDVLVRSIPQNSPQNDEARLRPGVLVLRKMEPLAATLPASKAASIGRTITRHSYLDWSLANTTFNL